VYLPDGGSTDIELSGVAGAFEVKWYDPRHGGELRDGTVTRIDGGGRRSLGSAPTEPSKDWAILIRRGKTDALQVDPRSSFLVKLRVPLASRSSRPGDAISASVISPEKFLGGKLEGIVDEASLASLRFSFRTLEFNGKRRTITSETGQFVNSKGHPMVDEHERRITVDKGRLVSTSHIELDEGAEIELEVRPVP
jgi:hypothetical protein